MSSKHEMISKKIKHLVGSGKDPKEAVAMALSAARKFAAGGMVEGEDEDYRSLGELQAEGVDMDGPASPEEQKERMGFAAMLSKKADDDGMNMENYAMGGLVEGEEDGELGSKPSEEMPSSEEPAVEPEKISGSGELDEAARQAIAEKKKKRRYA